MQNQNDPRSVQELIGESTLSAIVQKAQILDKINRCLPDVIHEMSAYCHVLNLKEECLILACTNSAMATQIRYREEELIIRLRRILPDLPPVERVECVVRPS